MYLKETRFVEVTEELHDYKSYISEGVTSFISTDCPPEGLTINACGFKGKVNIYISTTTRHPNSALNDEKIVIDEGECRDVFIECNTSTSERRKRQAINTDKIFIAIEGINENNEFQINASSGDTSTPKGRVL